MRRIEIGTAKVLIWVIATLAVWCASAAPASAQTYDFTFSGGGASVLDGVLTLSGGNVTSVSGTLSGVTPNVDNGTMSLFATGGSNFYTSPAAYQFGFEVNTSGGGSDFLSLTPGAGNSQIVAANGATYTGASSATPTPSPLPGSGPLSFLVFGFVGLFIMRKQLAASRALPPCRRRHSEITESITAVMARLVQDTPGHDGKGAFI